MGRAVLLLFLVSLPLVSAETRKRYFAHETREDAFGVIAPWYQGQNGQFDFRVRVAAETIKRYPWVTQEQAVAVAPAYVFNNTWRISPAGVITVPPLDNWTTGAVGQANARVIMALVEYYRYSGDPAAIAHLGVAADVLLRHCLTPPDHAWPGFLISVPVNGKPYGDCDAGGWIQLDIVGEAGIALLRAYQLTGNTAWLNAVRHWADVLVSKRNRRAGAAPWGRYANPRNVRWGNLPSGNVQTGGLVYQLLLLDDLIRLGYRGEADSYLAARDGGMAYLRDVLLPAWTENDTWGRNYWDWEDPVQSQTTTDFTVQYLLRHKDYFTNWKNDCRNILSLFLNHTSVNPESKGEVYSGAWAFPESLSCCGSSLAWGPMELAAAFAQYGVEAASGWAVELARRQQTLATYDFHENGVAEDNIDGGAIAAGGWFNGTHPSAIEWVLRTMAWLPEFMGPRRENHILRTSAVVTSVSYRKGRISYSTFDAPPGVEEILRLAFRPQSVVACGRPWTDYRSQSLAGGDYLVTIRHQGCKDITVQGEDPQVEMDAGSSAAFDFRGNQVRLIGRVSPDGGRADVFLDDVRQLAGVDFWNPRELTGQVLFYRSGMTNGPHTLRIVPAGGRNPLSVGTRTRLETVQYSEAAGGEGFGEGGGPREAQRMILGYPGRDDYIDAAGNPWRPATEFVVRTGKQTDSVARAWWTVKQAVFVENTADRELYQYGVHAPEFVVNVTVAPGKWHVRLKFAETQYAAPGRRLFGVQVNGLAAARNLDVFARAGKANKAFDLDLEHVEPRNGIIEIRLRGELIDGRPSEAILQALAIEPEDRR
jgi:hypothetical protein